MLSTGPSTAVGGATPVRHLPASQGDTHDHWLSTPLGPSTRCAQRCGQLAPEQDHPSVVPTTLWTTVDNPSGTGDATRHPRGHGRTAYAPSTARRRRSTARPPLIHRGEGRVTCTDTGLSTGSTPPTTMTRSLSLLSCPDDLPVDARPGRGRENPSFRLTSPHPPSCTNVMLPARPCSSPGVRHSLLRLRRSTTAKVGMP